MYTQADQVLKGKKNEYDTDTIVSLLLCYKHNFNIYSIMKEIIQYLVDWLCVPGLVLSDTIGSVVTQLEFIIKNPNLAGGVLNALKDSLEESLNSVNNKEKKQYVKTLENVYYYVAVSLNTYLVYIEYVCFKKQESELRENVECSLQQSYVYMANKQYLQMTRLIKESISITQRFCLISEPLPVIVNMELAEKYSRRFARSKGYGLVEAALQAASKMFFYKKRYYTDDFFMVRLYGLLEVLLIELCRCDNLHVDYVKRTMAKLISAHCMQAIEPHEKNNEAGFQDDSSPYFYQTKYSHISRELERNIVLNRVVKLFHVYCNSDETFYILEQQLNKLLESPEDKYDRPMRELIAELISNFNESLKKLKISQDVIEQLIDNKIILKEQLEVKYYKITPAVVNPYQSVEQQLESINMDNRSALWSKLSEKIEKNDDIPAEVNRSAGRQLESINRENWFAFWTKLFTENKLFVQSKLSEKTEKNDPSLVK